MAARDRTVHREPSSSDPSGLCVSMRPAGKTQIKELQTRDFHSHQRVSLGGALHRFTKENSCRCFGRGCRLLHRRRTQTDCPCSARGRYPPLSCSVLGANLDVLVPGIAGRRADGQLMTSDRRVAHLVWRWILCQSLASEWRWVLSESLVFTSIHFCCRLIDVGFFFWRSRRFHREALCNKCFS